MSGLIDKRKRSREDDVSCESTPLSKRINNLHLSNFEEANYTHHQQQEAPHHSTHNSQIEQHLSKDMLMHQHASSSTSTSTGGVAPANAGGVDAEKTMYDPELNETDNPFYYNKNKLLHELHLERLKRCSV